MNYAIVDIETDGGVKITEISIFIFDGEQVIDEFTTFQIVGRRQERYCR